MSLHPGSLKMISTVHYIWNNGMIIITFILWRNHGVLAVSIKRTYFFDIKTIYNRIERE